VTQKSTSPHAGNLLLQNSPVRRARKTQDKAHKAKSALCHDQLKGNRYKTKSLPRLRTRIKVTRTDLTMFSEIMALMDCCWCVLLTEHLTHMYSNNDIIYSEYYVTPRISSFDSKTFLMDSILNFLPKQSNWPQPNGAQYEWRTLS
jgi:hypothetical protein